MSEQTININNNEIAVYAKTLRQLLNENALCEIERKLRKLLTQVANDEQEAAAGLSPLRSAFMDSYFNGAPDEEMKVFSRINAGKFFSDSAFVILKKIMSLDSDDCESMLRQYLTDRAQFVKQAEESLKKLADKGLINK